MSAPTPCAVLLHANLLYAEFPLQRMGTVVEQSYVPVLRMLGGLKGARAAINLSGFTLELLNGEHPELYRGSPEAVALLRELAAARRVEITGSSWAHAILPALPPRLALEDLRRFRRTASRVLGAEPQGFFPPEMATAPTLPGLLVETGYRWTFVDADLVALSARGALNAFNEYEPQEAGLGHLTAKAKFKGPLAQLRQLLRLERHLGRLRGPEPLLWQGAGDARIPALPGDAAWLAYSLVCLSRTAGLSERRLFKLIGRAARLAGTGLLLPYYGDLEFFGYGGNTIREPVPVSRLEALLRALADDPAIALTLPGDYAARELSASRPAAYIKSGSWSSRRDFALWSAEPDNQVLDRTCERAFALFQDREARLDPELRDKVLEKLLLAWNSDGRGWTPIAEHRLFCFDRALEAQRLLERA